MALSGALLLGGLAVDLLTPQALVVAIAHNIPIALASLSRRRYAPLVMAGLAFLANVLSGYANAVATPLDTTAVLNRALAAASFVLVGLLSMALRGATARATALGLEQRRFEREEALRHFLEALSGPAGTPDLLERITPALVALLQARNVPLVGVEGRRYMPPLFGAPERPASVRIGEAVSWPVDAVLHKDASEAPVFQSRDYEGVILTGRVERAEAATLVVLVDAPAMQDGKERLADAIRFLEGLLERATLIDTLQHRQALLGKRNDVIRDLIYAFSHDLRTPLMANAMNMKQALDGAFGDLTDEYRRTLEHGLDANRELLELADELLLVARHESGETRPPPEPVDLAALARDEASRRSPALGANGVSLDIEAPPSLVVSLRPADIRRVLQNLLDNAVRYAPEGTRVRLALELSPDEAGRAGVRMVVEDAGPGVAAAQRTRLFQRFSSGRAGGGLGLGLYLAKQIVETHGGTIEYAPLTPNGSRFSVWLPLTRTEVAA